MASLAEWARLGYAMEELTGRTLSDHQHSSFSRYVELILTWSRSQRLTAFRTARELIDKLFIDSLLFLPFIPSRPCKLVDIGSGVGVPGIPLRIVNPSIDLTLIEARRKRVSFLNAVVRELGLADVEVLHGRAEEVVRQRADLSGSHDLAVMRSAGRVETHVPIAGSYLKPSGMCVVSGPPPRSEEEPVPPVRGFAAERKIVEVPGLGVRRVLLLFTRRT